MGNNELQHWGIKGMKWGKRRFENYDGTLTPAGKERYDNDTPVSKKQRKLETKVTKKYTKAGKYHGYAEDSRRQGDKAAEKYTKDADVLDKQAKSWQKKGHVIAAEIARRRAQSLKDKGAAARKQYDEEADYYDSIAKHYKERADKFATKKKVNLGKEKVDSIIKNASEKKVKELEDYRELERKWAEWEKENE